MFLFERSDYKDFIKRCIISSFYNAAILNGDKKRQIQLKKESSALNTTNTVNNYLRSLDLSEYFSDRLTLQNIYGRVLTIESDKCVLNYKMDINCGCNYSDLLAGDNFVKSYMILLFCFSPILFLRSVFSSLKFSGVKNFSIYKDALANEIVEFYFLGLSSENKDRIKNLLGDFIIKYRNFIFPKAYARASDTKKYLDMINKCKDSSVRNAVRKFRTVLETTQPGADFVFYINNRASVPNRGIGFGRNIFKSDLIYNLPDSELSKLSKCHKFIELFSVLFREVDEQFSPVFPGSRTHEVKTYEEASSTATSYMEQHFDFNCDKFFDESDEFIFFIVSKDFISFCHSCEGHRGIPDSIDFTISNSSSIPFSLLFDVERFDVFIKKLIGDDLNERFKMV